MKTLSIIILALTVVSCGKETEGGNGSTCISRTAKILECRALEAAARYYSTPYQLELDEEKCKRMFPVEKCY